MSARVWSGAAGVSAAAAVVCGALAAVEYAREQRPAEPEPAWTITPEEVELGEVPVGEHTVVFEMTNPADRPRRIVGLNEGCQGGVCLVSRHHEQVTVPAGGTFRYECTVRIGRPGPFEQGILVHLEDGGIRTVTLAARGTGRAAGGRVNNPNEPR
jgi:hypothetical protein